MGLAELDRWFRCNMLTLNLKKTEYVYFSGPGRREGPPGTLRIGGEEVAWAEGVRFFGVWVDRWLSWVGHIQRVTVKVRQLLGVIGRASGVLDGRLLLSLYNGMVLPQLQYCLMVWGDFDAGRNGTRGEALVRLQKRFVRLMAGRRGVYHADPLFARFGVLKVGDLYRQQVRVHAWKFWNGKLPENQAAMLQRVDERHSHGTRAAVGGLAVGSRDHRSVGYRVPVEWGSLSGELRGMGWISGFKRSSRAGFLAGYRGFVCGGGGLSGM